MLGTLRAYAPFLAFLFVAANILAGLFLVWVAERSPLHRLLRSCSGVAGPFIGVAALLFGLYSAFLANEVWSQREAGRAAVAREAEKLHLLLEVTTALGPSGRALHALSRGYGESAVAEGWNSPEGQALSRRALDRMMKEALLGEPGPGDATVRRVLTDAVTAVADARRDRMLVASSRNAHAKWVVTYIFALIVQMVLILVHLGKPSSSIASTVLFSCAVSLSMMAILSRMDPFSGLNPIPLTPIEAVLGSGV